MRQFYLLILVLIAVPHLKSDDIYLKNGFVIKNAFIKDTVDNYIILEASNGTRRFPVSQILKVVRVDIDPSKGAIMEKFDDALAESNFESIIQNTQKKADSIKVSSELAPTLYRYEFPNMKLWPVTIVCIFLAYDNYDQANNIKDILDYAELTQKDVPAGYPKLDLSIYESEISKRRVIAAGFAILAIINTVYASEKVAVKISTQSISMSYNY